MGCADGAGETRTLLGLLGVRRTTVLAGAGSRQESSVTRARTVLRALTVRALKHRPAVDEASLAHGTVFWSVKVAHSRGMGIFAIRTAP